MEQKNSGRKALMPLTLPIAGTGAAMSSIYIQCQILP
jgi:hypothetical protein